MEQKRSIREILCFTAVSFLIVAVSFWAEAVFNCKKVLVYQEKMTSVLQHKVFEKTRSLDIRVYDSEEFYTMITLVNEECKDRMVSVLENTLRLLEYAAVFVSIIGYSLTIDVIAPVIGCLSLAVNYAINQKLVQLQVAYDRKLKDGKERKCLRTDSVSPGICPGGEAYGDSGCGNEALSYAYEKQGTSDSAVRR